MKKEVVIFDIYGALRSPPTIHPGASRKMPERRGEGDRHWEEGGCGRLRTMKLEEEE
jgi:hypothetical protein